MLSESARIKISISVLLKSKLIYFSVLRRQIKENYFLSTTVTYREFYVFVMIIINNFKNVIRKYFFFFCNGSRHNMIIDNVNGVNTFSDSCLITELSNFTSPKDSITLNPNYFKSVLWCPFRYDTYSAVVYIIIIIN